MAKNTASTSTAAPAASTSETAAAAVAKVFADCKAWNTAVRESALPPMPEVSVAGYTFPSTTVAKLVRLGLERNISANTAGKVSASEIGKLLDAMSSGYLTPAEREKALKVTTPGKSGTSGKLYPQDRIIGALESLGFDRAASTVRTFDAEKFVLVYTQQLSVDGSKIAAAHAKCRADDEAAEAAKVAAALSEVDLSDL